MVRSSDVISRNTSARNALNKFAKPLRKSTDRPYTTWLINIVKNIRENIQHPTERKSERKS